MDLPHPLRAAPHEPAEPALSHRDRAIVATAALAAVAFTALGFAAGFLAAPAPLDMPGPRCPAHTLER